MPAPTRPIGKYRSAVNDANKNNSFKTQKYVFYIDKNMIKYI